jgi:hypothetical protein
MKSDRLFYSASGAVFLLAMLISFHPFYTHGTGMAGRMIEPVIFPLVLVHGSAIAAWYVLFFVQSLLINIRNRPLHMKLGWSAVAIGLTIACTGSLVAIRSVQVTPADFRFFGMQYSRFLLVMLVEIALFTAFLTAGILVRKKPKIHRPMMVLASLCLLAGATARMPFLYPLFGKTGWVGLFGPVACLGAVLFLVRLAQTRTFDRWFAAGYAFYVISFIVAEKLALTSTWNHWANKILQV